MVLVTALVVARPLVPGDDPGLLDPRTSPAGVVLTFFWLLAAVGWAAWRLWSGEAAWRGGLVEAALVAVAGLFFLSAGVAAPYRHPAWLIAWEWVGLLVAFSLVRQLAATPAERRGLVAAVLATGVSLAAYAVYQDFVDLPRVRAASPARTAEAGVPEYLAWPQRPPEPAVTATFSHPETFAAFLVLVLPAVVVYLLASWRRVRWAWQTLLLGGCVLLGGVALWLAWAPAAAGNWWAERLDGWTAAWRMVLDHPWLGVGPGNFGRRLPQYLVSTATERLTDARSFPLEMGAAAGVFALVALLAAVALFFRQAWAANREPTPANAGDGPAVPTEAYLGGMGGLLLGFVLHAATLPAAEIPWEAGAVAFRSVFWFVAFALFVHAPWPGSALRFGLAAGVAACLLYLLVSSGITFPALAQPLWVVAALAVAPAPPRPEPAFRHRLALLLPLPLLAGVALTYALVVLYPAATCANALNRFRINRQEFRGWSAKDKAGNKALAYLPEINRPLKDAREVDPQDVRPFLESARWALELGELYHGHRYAEEAVKYLAEARPLDPVGTEVDGTEFEIRLRFAERFTEGRKEHFEAAARLLDDLVAHDPTQAARLHFRLAEAYFAAKDAAEGRRQAELARNLDEEAPGPAYRLPPPQLEKVRGWLKAPPAG